MYIIYSNSHAEDYNWQPKNENLNASYINSCLLLNLSIKKESYVTKKCHFIGISLLKLIEHFVQSMFFYYNHQNLLKVRNKKDFFKNLNGKLDNEKH